MTHPKITEVAKAILGGEAVWDELPHWVQLRYEDRARAAVQALLESTPDMLEIGMDYDEREIEIATGTPPTPDQCVAGQFRAMLAPLLED